MKKILNWTFGGFFRAFGRILCFLVVGGIIAYLIASNDFKLPDILSFGIMRVNAASVDYTYKKYRIRYYSLATGDDALTPVTDMGTRTELSNDYGVSMVSARFGWSSRFQAGTTYRVTIDTGFAPSSIESSFLNVDDFICLGSSTTSSWDAQQNLISTCNFIGSSLNNSGRINYIFDITPLSNVQGIQFNIYYGVTEEVSAVNVRPTSTITYGDDPTGAINEQTIIIEQEFENISNIKDYVTLGIVSWLDGYYYSNYRTVTQDTIQLRFNNLAINAGNNLGYLLSTEVDYSKSKYAFVSIYEDKYSNESWDATLESVGAVNQTVTLTLPSDNGKYYL